IGSNVVSDNGDHGISLISGATHCTIEDNESFRNVYALGRRANGLYMFGCPNNVVQRNRWHDNQDSGEQMQGGSDNNLSIQNVSWANGDHGFDRYGAANSLLSRDVAFGN